MKRLTLSFSFLIALTLVGMFAIASCAQSRTNRIYRPCPSTSVTSRVEVQQDGDIDLVPCSGRSVLINGVATSNTLTVSGSSRTNFFPYYSTETNLAKSPFSWNGTLFSMNNTAADSEFTLDFTPSTASGLFRVGDFTTTETNYLTLNQATGVGQFNAVTQLYLDSPEVWLGDVVGLSNQTRIVIDAPANEFQFASGGLNAIFNTVGVSLFTFNRTTTPGATTGNQTIHKPAGTVNFAAGTGTAGLTVTNNTVTVESYVLAVARTNDATCSVKNVVPANGSFTIRMDANCTAETSVGFLVLN